jgi:hypothetical protein
LIKKLINLSASCKIGKSTISFNLFNSVGITEGSPRLGENQTEEEFFVGRPIIPRTAVVNLTFNF